MTNINDEISKAILEKASLSSLEELGVLKEQLEADVEEFFSVELGGADDVEEDVRETATS